MMTYTKSENYNSRMVKLVSESRVHKRSIMHQSILAIGLDISSLPFVQFH